MKRIMLTLTVLFFVASTQIVAAQRGHSGGLGLPNGTGLSANSPANAHANVGDTLPAPHSAASASPDRVLGDNTKLDTTLTTNLQSKNLLAVGTDLKSTCSGFRNLGQCVAAIHVSHNLNVPFACMKADMIGQAPPSGTTCPTGTGSSKLSLGKSIASLDASADSKTSAKLGTTQANADIGEAESASVDSSKN